MIYLAIMILVSVVVTVLGIFTYREDIEDVGVVMLTVFAMIMALREVMS